MSILLKLALENNKELGTENNLSNPEYSEKVFDQLAEEIASEAENIINQAATDIQQIKMGRPLRIKLFRKMLKLT
jgi:vacuolar-type H+-ATPase subunit H